MDGVEHYGFPMNEWHHFALTADGQSLKLYIDGRLWYDDMLVIPLTELEALQFTIGGTIWDTPTFNGLVDDAYLYNFALTEEQVLIAAGGGDPLDVQAAPPDPTEPYIPTQPSQTTISTAPSASVTQPEQGGDPFLGGDHLRPAQAHRLSGGGAAGSVPYPVPCGEGVLSDQKKPERRP